MTHSTDALNEEYTIDTPENVSIGYSVAGIGNRFIAALIDSALLGGVLIIAQILLLAALAAVTDVALLFEEETTDWRRGLVMALYTLGSFTIFWGYFIFFEWFWNGQTPGKRVSKIRVVRMDGSPPRFLDIAVRNLLRIIDFLPFGYGLGLIVMFFNREARRLGDIAAGVMVVKDRGELRLEAITSPVSGADRFQTDRSPAITRTEARSEPHIAPAEPALESPHPATDGAPGMSSVPTDTAPSQTTLSQTAPAPDPGTVDDPALRFPTIRRLRVADYELMQESLRRHDAGTLDAGLLTRLAQAMSQKAGGDAKPTTWTESRRCLVEIMHAYRAYHQ